MRILATFVVLACVPLVVVSLTAVSPSTVIQLDGPSEDLLFAAPEGFEQAAYTFGAIPAGSPGGGDTGMTIVISRGHGLLIYGPVVNVGPGSVLMQCELQSTSALTSWLRESLWTLPWGAGCRTSTAPWPPINRPTAHES